MTRYPRFVRFSFNSVHALCLQCPHHTGIKAPFAFQSLALASSVGASGDAEGSVPVGLVGSGDGLHTPTCYSYKKKKHAHDNLLPRKKMQFSLSRKGTCYLSKAVFVLGENHFRKSFSPKPACLAVTENDIFRKMTSS